MPPRGQVIPAYPGLNEISPARDRFCVIGDTQRTSAWEFWRERNDQERKALADEMLRRKPAFVVILGDLTTRGSSAGQWAEFDIRQQVGRDQGIGYFPLLGNHDLYGSDKESFRNYFERFPHLENRHWYSFTWRNVGFILLDSNFHALGRRGAEVQARWYQAELGRFEQRQDVDYIIVGCHHPPFTNSRIVSPSPEVQRLFAEPFQRSRKGAIFFSGHCHAYEKFRQEGKWFLVSGGGGGPRQRLNINPNTRPYPDLFAGAEVRFLHFCELEVVNQSLTLSVVRVDKGGAISIADRLAVPAAGAGAWRDQARGLTADFQSRPAL
jgi:3',5'-cyclic AMP phosphodiesterase CpdA